LFIGKKKEQTPGQKLIVFGHITERCCWLRAAGVGARGDRAALAAARSRRKSDARQRAGVLAG
jgi:hypothetical protein